MTKSTLYVKCPGCGKTALMQELQGLYICASCNFDYTKLKDNPEKLDELIISNLKEGPAGQLMALTVHRMISLMEYTDSINHVKELAEKNGIVLPGQKKGFFSRIFG